jgi:predicted nuclease of predicted toxin-antitoxin system
MRLLLDNNIPYRFKADLGAFDRSLIVDHVQDHGLAHLLDGPLLDVIAENCDVLLTMDKSLPHQNNLANRRYAVLVLRAKSNRRKDLLPLLSEILKLLPSCEASKWYVVEA